MNTVSSKEKKATFEPEFVKEMEEKALQHEALGSVDVVQELTGSLKNTITYLNDFGDDIDTNQEFLCIYFSRPYGLDSELSYAVFDVKTDRVIVISIVHSVIVGPVAIMKRRSFFDYVESLPNIYKHADVWSNRKAKKGGR